MSFYKQDYIIPGDIFKDQTVLCMRCNTIIIRTGYREMPSKTDPGKTVNVACQLKQSNYRLLPVVTKRENRLGILNLPLCSDCIKVINVTEDSEEIMNKIRAGMLIESKWVGESLDALDNINSTLRGMEILRTLTPQEIREGRIMEVA